MTFLSRRRVVVHRRQPRQGTGAGTRTWLINRGVVLGGWRVVGVVGGGWGRGGGGGLGGCGGGRAGVPRQLQQDLRPFERGCGTLGGVGGLAALLTVLAPRNAVRSRK